MCLAALSCSSCTVHSSTHSGSVVSNQVLLGDVSSHFVLDKIMLLNPGVEPSGVKYWGHCVNFDIYMVFVAAAGCIQTLTPGTGGSCLFLFLIVQCFKVPFPVILVVFCIVFLILFFQIWRDFWRKQAI